MKMMVKTYKVINLAMQIQKMKKKMMMMKKMKTIVMMKKMKMKMKKLVAQ